MIDRIKSLIRGSQGFSLGEVLVAILILLMMTSIVTAGMPAATNAYYKVVDAANAQTLLSTTMTSMRDELSTAKNITTEKISAGDTGDKKVVYIGSDGIETSIKYMETITSADAAKYKDGPGIYIENINYTTLLVSKAAANKNLHACFRSISYSDGIVTVKDLSVRKDGTTTDLAYVPTFLIRVIT